MIVLGRLGRQLDHRGRLLNTFPPRSSTKWLCVATKPKTIDKGVRNLLDGSIAILDTKSAHALDLRLTPKHRFVRECSSMRPQYSRDQLCAVAWIEVDNRSS